MDPINLINVTCQIGSRTILHDISIGFKKNKVTAIIGKSGSGKSTLLKMINGLLKPTMGQVKVFDSAIDYSNLKALRKNIGYAVQGIGLFPHLTVEENILLAGKTHLSIREIRKERLHELMKLVNLPDRLLSRYPYELSGGSSSAQEFAALYFSILLYY
ncbi:MAG: ATP-binding cassette domain-containing protein [Bacteroidota bacterium]